MHVKNQFKKSEAGFTLIELMVVVVILAILAAVAIPMYQNSVSDNLAGEATQTMSAWKAAELARMQAGLDARTCSTALPASTNFTYAGSATSGTSYNICTATCTHTSCNGDTIVMTLATGSPPTANMSGTGDFANLY